MVGPYKGLKVIELGRFIAAPYCGQLFADGGANVIKVEPVTGDDARRNGTRLSATESRQYLNKNRGKRSLAVQLSNPSVAEAVRSMLRDADVAITNFRPGQGEKLGLDYQTVSRQNPRIIYAENSAFGPRGPLSGRAGMDILLQAYTGMTQGPDVSEDPVIDYTAALLMAWGVSTALYNREKTGVGQRLDVSLLQAALVIQNNSVNHVDQVDGWRDDYVEYLKDAFRQGRSFDEVLIHRESLKPTIKPPYYGFFQTSDGCIAIAASGRRLQGLTAELLGIEDPKLADHKAAISDIAAYTSEIRNQVAARLLEHSTDYWVNAFLDAGIPAGIVQLKDQILDDPQVWDNEYLIRLEHEEVGGLTVVAPPVQFSETPLQADTASPVLGKHTREILLEAGLSDRAIDALIADNCAMQNC